MKAIRGGKIAIITTRISDMNELKALITKLVSVDTNIDIKVRQGDYCVDGHSVLGILSLDYSLGALEITFSTSYGEGFNDPEVTLINSLQAIVELGDDLNKLYS